MLKLVLPKKKTNSYTQNIYTYSQIKYCNADTAFVWHSGRIHKKTIKVLPQQSTQYILLMLFTHLLYI